MSSRKDQARAILNVCFSKDFDEAERHGITKKACWDYMWRQLSKEEQDRALATASAPKSLKFQLPLDKQTSRLDSGRSGTKAAALNATPTPTTTSTHSNSLLDKLFATSSDEEQHLGASSPAVRQPALAMASGRADGVYWGMDGYLSGVADIKEDNAKRAFEKAAKEPDNRRVLEMAEQAGREAKKARESADAFKQK